MRGFLKIVVLIMMLVGVGYNVNGLTTLIQPVAKSTDIADGRDLIRASLAYLQCPRSKILQIEHGIKIATSRTGIGGLLLASLLYTESNFKTGAISPKGYKGIAQTPTATMIYPEVDILHGAMILRDKLRLTDGNMYKALALYKGGNNPVAQLQAEQVLQVYHQVVKAVG